MPSATVPLAVIKRFLSTEHTSFDLHVNATKWLNHTYHQVVRKTVGAITSTAGTHNAVPGQNNNVRFGSWGLTTVEARQLVVQAYLRF